MNEDADDATRALFMQQSAPVMDVRLPACPL